MLQDIATLKDIHNLVDAFYDKVRKDQTIGFFFNERLEGKWEAHHKKLYRFWHTVLPRRPDYFGNPVPVHFNIELKRENFYPRVHVRVTTWVVNLSGTCTFQDAAEKGTF